MDKQPKETKISDTEKICQEYLAGWKRCKADFENYKKAEAERMSGAILFAKQDVLLEFLGIFDNFERIKAHLPAELENNEWAKGVFLVENQFAEALKTLGLQEIKALGEKFDPALHEAVKQTEEGGKESGAIIEVVQKGYTLNGKVLRPAKVKVIK